MNGNLKATGVLHTAQMQHLGAYRCKFQHLFVREPIYLGCSADSPGIGSEDAIDVGVDLTHFSFQGGCQGHRSGV